MQVLSEFATAPAERSFVDLLLPLRVRQESTLLISFGLLPPPPFFEICL
jgi:hypothetical protein